MASHGKRSREKSGKRTKRLRAAKAHVDSWLTDPDDNAYTQGYSAMMNEGALNLDHPLYHYTSESGLDGILRTGELWGTSPSFMDDLLEVKPGWALIADIIDGFSSGSTAFDSILKRLAAVARRGRDINRFVVSFCSEPDYLLAWRAYADDGRGYCLEFAPDGLRTTGDWYLARAEYNVAEQRAEVLRILARMARAYRSVSSIASPLLEERAAITTQLWLTMLAPTLKDRRYESEREWRSIRMVGTSDLAETVRYRLRSGEEVPYAVRPIDASTESASHLSKVICGARISDSTLEAVTRLVHRRFPKCSVVRSQIPVRGAAGRP